ncbi:hypothetical protein CNEO4_1220002 [Clostridium neonatale]|nr:hypothetical protein CNEO4_1220002 [Clostridium neonatale]CAI3565743.1 hypothetical protein CNEO2_1610003 [Clostridium neonatale]CAI3575263.1 hypothetical protein CNEO4_1270036 [Clostridium neonatale]CAI3621051.1 hypothetical protein CNEO2_2750002 [Clostridium neonatale]CAI3658745.1 hypothetical protein CNEO4_3710001 [Clostridium neonatale]
MFPYILYIYVIIIINIYIYKEKYIYIDRYYILYIKISTYNFKSCYRCRNLCNLRNSEGLRHNND